MTLFFTEGLALENWDSVGLLEREIALYRALGERAVQTSFVTYGGNDERRYAGRVSPVAVLSNRWGLPPSAYRRLIPVLHGLPLARSDLIKTNQIQATPAAVAAARFWRKPLVVRCGYLLSSFADRERGPDSPQAIRARHLEEMAFSRAARVIVTTEPIADAVRIAVPAMAARTHVIPNYVDTRRFRPRETTIADVDVLFVGRLAGQKNPRLLLEALRRSGLSARMVGQGPLKEPLRSEFADIGSRIDWIDRVPNDELPDFYNRCRMFVLPSRYEGHPKTLIEAMACGCTVIGTAVPGIRDVIRTGETGLLVPEHAADLADAMRRVIGDDGLRASLGAAARRFVSLAYGLDRIADAEREVLDLAVRGAVPA